MSTEQDLRAIRDAALKVVSWAVMLGGLGFGLACLHARKLFWVALGEAAP